MTHEELRKRAVTWLSNTRHSSVVISEIVTTGTQERPDAIGFQSEISVAVECKVSRSDFLANFKKTHVVTHQSVGQFRYFMTPEGLLKPDEIPDPYGLLEVRGSRILIAKQAVRVESNMAAERSMLVSALRRVKTREFLILNTCVCCGENAA